MIEIHGNLFIGNLDDYEFDVRRQDGWYIVHACKEPYHRQLLGYTGRGAPKGHPEYLMARRSNRLFLNLIDPDDPKYIPKEIIDAALEYIKEGLDKGLKVLVHCNLGESRAPTIGFLYLIAHTDKIQSSDFLSAENEFRKIYPVYNPSGALRGFAQLNFKFYLSLNQR